MPTATATWTLVSQTSTPTATWTPVSQAPTATPTGTPTLTPTGASSILSDDFNDGNLNGWTPVGGAWTNPGDYMRGQYSTGGAWCMSTVTGGDIVYEGKVNLFSGNVAGLTFRSSADGASSYDVAVDAADGRFELSIRPSGALVVGAGMTVERNHWYTIRVVAKGDLIECYLDGYKYLSVNDSTYTTGYLGAYLSQATAGYDDLAANPAP
jgi:hypothetical protein